MSDQNALSITELQQKAEMGDAQAQLELAYRFSEGEGIESNKEMALKWLEKAAQAGNRDAQYRLANCYLEEGMEEQYYELAFKWLKIFVEADDISDDDCCNGYLILGDLYAKGKGVQSNDEMAMQCYEQVTFKCQALFNEAINGIDEKNRGTLIMQFKQLKQKYRPKIDNELATLDAGISWAVFIEAKNRLADYYHKQATNIGLSEKQAYVWHDKASSYGCAESQYWLAKYYLSGVDLDRIYDGAWYTIQYSMSCDASEREAYKAIENGVTEANLVIGFIYFYKLSDFSCDQENSFIYFESALGHSEQGIAEYFLWKYYDLYVWERNNELAQKYLEQADLSKVWSYYGIETIIENHEYLRKNFEVLFKDSDLILKKIELEQKNKQLEIARSELEEMMSMFAHKFRSPLDAIIYNTTHENQVKLYAEAAQTMRGLLDVFSIISTDPEILKVKIKRDNQGTGSLLSVFIKTLDMIMLHLLSASGAEKIQQHYMTYAKTHGLCSPELSYKSWIEENFELEQQLQSEWEQSFAHLLGESDKLEPRLTWLEQRFFKLELSGFDEANIQFRANGVTESFLMILLNEILVNAFKYYSSATRNPVVLEWTERDGHQVFICRNPSVRSERTIIKGSHKGHAFLSTLARKTGSQFVKPQPQDEFVLEFAIPNELLLAP